MQMRVICKSCILSLLPLLQRMDSGRRLLILHCDPKNNTPLACYNFDVHQSISMNVNSSILQAVYFIDVKKRHFCCSNVATNKKLTVTRRKKLNGCIIATIPLLFVICQKGLNRFMRVEVTIITRRLARGTARRAILVNWCYVSRAMGVIQISNSKSDLQGHSRALAVVSFDRSHTISY